METRVSRQPLTDPELLESNTTFFIATVVAAVFVLLAGVLRLQADYFELDYSTGARPSMDTPDHGAQVWDVHVLALAIAYAGMFTALLSWLWQAYRKRPPHVWAVVPMLIVGALVAVVAMPKPFEFQARLYAGPAFPTYVLIAQDSADFIDGNEDRWLGYQETIEDELYYDEATSESRYFQCRTQREWWVGKLAIRRSFYPILDDANQLKLFQEHCTPTQPKDEFG
jgi:hypothetical protein